MTMQMIARARASQETTLHVRHLAQLIRFL
jgi:hypothetical protein